MFLRDRQVVDFQGTHVRLDGFLDVGQRGILRFALGDATGQAGALGDPKAIFPAIDQNLSHTFIMPDSTAQGEIHGRAGLGHRAAVYLHLRVLTGALRVLHATLTGGDAKVAVEAWNPLCLRGFRPARRSESVSGATLAAKCYTFQNGEGSFMAI